MAQFVREGPVSGGQALLDQEDVSIGVLPPLATHTRRQVRHLQLDGSAAVFCHRFHEARERYFPPPGC